MLATTTKVSMVLLHVFGDLTPVLAVRMPNQFVCAGTYNRGDLNAGDNNSGTGNDGNANNGKQVWGSALLPLTMSPV